PPWAPQRRGEGGNNDASLSSEGDGSGRARRPSLGGGMPAWAPPRPDVSAKQGRSTEEVHTSEGDLKKSVGEASSAGLPDWIAAATGTSFGDVATEPECAVSSTAEPDNKGNNKSGGLDWLTQAATGPSASPATSSTTPASTSAPSQKGGLSWLTAAAISGGTQGQIDRPPSTLKRKKS
ncbi:unnamed protein product, partial [Sphacelaria rigidula]